MAKRIQVARSLEGLVHSEFVDSLIGPGCEVYVTDPGPRPATAVVLGADDAPGCIASYEAEDREVWDEPISGEVYSMFAFFRPPAGKDDWLDCYRQHAEVARVHHPGIKRYVQDVVVSQSGEERWHMSAISELHFAGRDSYRDEFWLSDDSREIVQRDFERFSDPSTAKTIVAARVESPR